MTAATAVSELPAPQRFRLWTTNWHFAAGADVLSEKAPRGDHATVVIDADSNAGRYLLDVKRYDSVNVTIDGEDGRFIGVLKSWTLSGPDGRHARKDLTVVALDHQAMIAQHLVLPPEELRPEVDE